MVVVSVESVVGCVRAVAEKISRFEAGLETEGSDFLVKAAASLDT